MAKDIVYPRIPEPRHYLLDKAFILGSAWNWLENKAYDDSAEITVPRRSPRRLLDVACGTGLSTFRIARQFPLTEVIGLDENQEAIDMAKRLYSANGLPNLNFERANVYHIGRRFRESVDAVYTENSLHHFDNLDDAVRQIFETLREGGDFNFIDLNRRAWKLYNQNIKMPDGRVMPAIDGMYELMLHHPDEELLRMLFEGQLIEGAYVKRFIIFLQIVSRIAAYTPEEAEESIKKARFSRVFVGEAKTPGYYSGHAMK